MDAVLASRGKIFAGSTWLWNSPRLRQPSRIFDSLPLWAFPWWWARLDGFRNSLACGRPCNRAAALWFGVQTFRLGFTVSGRSSHRRPALLPRNASTRLGAGKSITPRSEEHTSELQSHLNLVCRLLLEKKKKYKN